MPDPSIGFGVQSFANGLLAGKQAKLNQDQYEFYKQQQAIQNEQKQREQDIQTLEAGSQAAGTAGSDVFNYLQSQLGNLYGQQTQGLMHPQRPQGLMNQQPGMIGSNKFPYSTVPQTDSQVNPGAGMPQIDPILVRQMKMAQLKDIQNKVTDIVAKGGKASIQYDQNGNPQVSVQDLGPQANAEITNLQHGGRSAENAINNQYGESIAVKTARGSQPNMAQMIDAYNHPSPQGDASMVLNAFKIKFPSIAPDVNSIEELQKSQSVPDTWKSMMSKAVNGEFDQGTRNNLLRDGISTYRANVSSLQEEQKKFSQKAKNAGIDPNIIVQEPAVMKTFQDSMAMQDRIGPYIPPTERGGLMNAAKGYLLKAVHAEVPQKQNQMDQKISSYAQKFNLTYPQAEQILRSRGYGGK